MLRRPSSGGTRLLRASPLLLAAGALAGLAAAFYLNRSHGGERRRALDPRRDRWEGERATAVDDHAAMAS